jgi:hypothetical protein
VLLPLHARLLLEFELVAKLAARPSTPPCDWAGAPTTLEMLTEVHEASMAYLHCRDHTFCAGSFGDLRLHAVLPGLVTNVSRHGLFVQIGDGLIGLVGIPELVGAPAPAAATSVLTVLPISDARTALSHFRVAQPLTVRVISLRSSGGHGLVGLSLHTGRINPRLNTHAQFFATRDEVAQMEGGTSARSAAGGALGDGEDGVKRTHWGRVLLVEDTKAVVSLELNAPYELHRADIAVAADSTDGVAPPPSLKQALTVGQLLRVQAASPSPAAAAAVASVGTSTEGRPRLVSYIPALKLDQVVAQGMVIASDVGEAHAWCGLETSSTASKRAWESGSERSDHSDDEEGGSDSEEGPAIAALVSVPITPGADSEADSEHRAKRARPDIDESFLTYGH